MHSRIFTLIFALLNASVALAYLPPLPGHLQGATIYALQLEQGKYYVGRSQSPDERIKRHFAGQGAAWTRRYKPVRVIWRQPANSIWDEDNEVERFMMAHGVDNVRGGTYVELTDAVKEFLEKKFRSMNDECYLCGELGHMISDCDADVFTDDTDTDSEEEEECGTCGRTSHSAAQCYARTDIDGRQIKRARR